MEIDQLSTSIIIYYQYQIIDNRWESKKANVFSYDSWERESILVTFDARLE